MTLKRGTEHLLIDSGAMHTATPLKHYLHGFVPEVFKTVDFHGDKNDALGYGYLLLKFGSKVVKFVAYYVPDCAETLISEYDLLDANFNFQIVSRSPIVVKNMSFNDQIYPLMTINRTFYIKKSHIIPSTSPTFLSYPQIRIKSLHI